jgi:antitoxin component of RelBE/YafQ-DinJ toxin-antitoxin module
MPRMGADEERRQRRGQTKVTTRCPEELKADYKDVLDEQGRSMSDDLREHMQAVVNAHSNRPDDGTVPGDDQLAAAYKALRRAADPDHQTVKTEVAETIVAEETRVRRAVVRSNVLKPLERRGYIEPRWGTVRVVDPANVQPEEPAATA